MREIVEKVLKPRPGGQSRADTCLSVVGKGGRRSDWS